MAEMVCNVSQKILDAAFLIYCEEGLEEISMRKVAQKSGIAVGTVYNRFDNKEDLLAQLLAHDIEHTKTIMMETVFAKEAEQALIDLMEVFVQDMMQDSRSIIRTMLEQTGQEDDMSHILYGAFCQIKQTVEELICRVYCKYNKVLTAQESALLADMTLAMLQTATSDKGGAPNRRAGMISGMLLSFAKSEEWNTGEQTDDEAEEDVATVERDDTLESAAADHL